MHARYNFLLFVNDIHSFSALFDNPNNPNNQALPHQLNFHYLMSYPAMDWNYQMIVAGGNVPHAQYHHSPADNSSFRLLYAFATEFVAQTADITRRTSILDLVIPF